MTIRIQDSLCVGRGVLVAGFTIAALMATAEASAVGKAPSASKAPAASASGADSMTLRAGQSGTEFRSMTVEGEDRVHVDFGRPELNLDLDPEDVPGLASGNAMDVLDRTVPDLASPLAAMSSKERSPYTARPWLRQFATG